MQMNDKYRCIMSKLINKHENIKIQELAKLKIDLKIYNKNDKISKNKIVPLKTLANLISPSR